MRLTANWTVKHKGKRYEPGETVYCDEEAAEAFIGSGACRYYDGPDAGKGDAKPAEKAGKKAGGKKAGQAPMSREQARAEAIARWGKDEASFANLADEDQEQRIASVLAEAAAGDQAQAA